MWNHVAQEKGNPVEQLKMDYDYLWDRFTGRCTECGVVMEGICRGRFDATSFFEQISLFVFETAVDSLKKAEGRTKQSDDDVECLRGFVKSSRSCAVGTDRTYKMDDTMGGPIGSPFSGVMSRVILCRAEGEHFSVLRGRSCKARRYEDDPYVQANRCPGCVRQMIWRVYPHPFECEEENVRDGVIDEGMATTWMDYEQSAPAGVTYVRQNRQRGALIPPYVCGDGAYGKMVFWSKLARHPEEGEKLISGFRANDFPRKVISSYVHLWKKKTADLRDIVKNLA